MSYKAPQPWEMPIGQWVKETSDSKASDHFGGELARTMLSKNEGVPSEMLALLLLIASGSTGEHILKSHAEITGDKLDVEMFRGLVRVIRTGPPDLLNPSDGIEGNEMASPSPK